MAKRARSETFDPVYPYGESQGPIKDGSLVITPPSTPSPVPPNTIINPVYPFGHKENILEDGKIVITGDTTSLLHVGTGLQIQNGVLNVSPEISSLIPVSSPITKTNSSISLNYSAPLTVQNNNLTLQVGEGFTTDPSLQYRLSSELSVANNMLQIANYCYAWTGLNSPSSFIYKGVPVKIYLSLERIGQHVYGQFSAWNTAQFTAPDQFSIHFFFNANGTLHSESTYSGAFGPRTGEGDIGPAANDQKLLIPSPSYNTLPKVTLTTVSLNTEGLSGGTTFTTATVLVVYNKWLPDTAAGGITFRFIFASGTTPTRFVGDLVNFSYLGIYPS